MLLLFIKNIITFFQQLYIKRTLDEKQLYAQLQANKTKPIKKSNFQKKLEEIAKQQKRKKEGNMMINKFIYYSFLFLLFSCGLIQNKNSIKYSSIQ